MHKKRGGVVESAEQGGRAEREGVRRRKWRRVRRREGDEGGEKEGVRDSHSH